MKLIVMTAFILLFSIYQQTAFSITKKQMENLCKNAMKITAMFAPSYDEGSVVSKHLQLITKHSKSTRASDQVPYNDAKKAIIEIFSSLSRIDENVKPKLIAALERDLTGDE